MPTDPKVQTSRLLLQIFTCILIYYLAQHTFSLHFVCNLDALVLLDATLGLDLVGVPELLVLVHKVVAGKFSPAGFAREELHVRVSRYERRLLSGTA